MKTLILILIFAVFIQGCATTYQAKGFTGGYSETQLDENVFNVTFRGNGYTRRERVSDFTLLRCAELTLVHGYRYFTIIDANSYTSNSTFTTPTTSQTTGSAYRYGNSVYGRSTTTTSGGETYNISKPSSSNTIVCFKEKPDSGFSYNASCIYKSISQKYDMQQSIKE
jgi:hypothetical protein